MIVKQIIRLTNNWIMDGTLEDIHEDLDSISLPVWDGGATLTNYRHSCDMRIVKQERRTSLTQSAAHQLSRRLVLSVQFFKQQDLLEI